MHHHVCMYILYNLLRWYRRRSIGNLKSAIDPESDSEHIGSSFASIVAIILSVKNCRHV